MAVYGNSAISNSIGYKGHKVILINASIESNKEVLEKALKILSSNSFSLESKAKRGFYQQAKSRGFIASVESNRFVYNRRDVRISDLSQDGGYRFRIFTSGNVYASIYGNTCNFRIIYRSPQVSEMNYEQDVTVYIESERININNERMVG